MTLKTHDYLPEVPSKLNDMLTTLNAEWFVTGGAAFCGSKDDWTDIDIMIDCSNIDILEACIKQLETSKILIDATKKSYPFNEVKRYKLIPEDTPSIDVLLCTSKSLFITWKKVQQIIYNVFPYLTKQERKRLFQMLMMESSMLERAVIKYYCL